MNAVSGIVAVIASSALLSGCITLPSSCSYEGDRLDGLNSLIRSERGGPTDSSAGKRLKVLVIHGIGRQEADYAKVLAGSLADRLGFEPQGNPFKFNLSPPPSSIPELASASATLDVYRYGDEDSPRRLEVFGLGWSNLTRSTDAQNYNDLRQPELPSTANRVWKSKLNERVYDVARYIGERNDEILDSVSQSICWMLRPAPVEANVEVDSKRLPRCSAQKGERYDHLKHERFAIITHSLGSDIAIQALERRGRDLALERKVAEPRPEMLAVGNELRTKEVMLFMLSNQLPLLETARAAPKTEITGRLSDYCELDEADSSTPIRGDERWLKRLHIAAISDPNDLLSYRLQPGFPDMYVDSRLCPRVTNVYTNVTEQYVIALVGLLLPQLFHESNVVAHPVKAHTEYHRSPRVLSMIVEGIHDPAESAGVAQSCTPLSPKGSAAETRG